MHILPAEKGAYTLWAWLLKILQPKDIVKEINLAYADQIWRIFKISFG